MVASSEKPKSVLVGKHVVYTALCGDYELINELEIKHRQETRYVCFTDKENLESKTWEVIVVEEFTSEDPIRRSREIKMLAHQFFETNSKILYIDNAVQLKIDGAEILESLLDHHPIAVFHHSRRKTVLGEFVACSKYGLDDYEVIRDQFRQYTNDHLLTMLEVPYWGGFVAKVNCSETDSVMKSWFQQYMLFSKRDQLSFNVALAIAPCPINIVDYNNAESKWHKWPKINSRNYALRDSTSNLKFRKIVLLKNLLQSGIDLSLIFLFACVRKCVRLLINGFYAGKHRN